MSEGWGHDRRRGRSEDDQGRTGSPADRASLRTSGSGSFEGVIASPVEERADVGGGPMGGMLVRGAILVAFVAVLLPLILAVAAPVIMLWAVGSIMFHTQGSGRTGLGMNWPTLTSLLRGSTRRVNRLRKGLSDSAAPMSGSNSFPVQSFRLHVANESGGWMVDCALRGQPGGAPLLQGDRIGVSGKWSKGQVFVVKQATNLASGAQSWGVLPLSVRVAAAAGPALAIVLGGAIIYSVGRLIGGA
jgi:hypothetical protein